MTAELAVTANEHWLAAYRLLVALVGGEFRRFGSVNAFIGGVPVAFANGCLILEPAHRSDIERAVQWVASHDLPYGVRIDPVRSPDAGAACASVGLVEQRERMPAMVLSPIRAAPVPPSSVTTRRADAASYDLLIELQRASGLSRRLARAVFPRHLLDHPDVVAFIAELDGRPVGTAMAIRTGDVAGVYSVATAEAARRKGVGTTVTWAAVDAARSWGCRAVVLQASAMGFPVYRSMGFAVAVEYTVFGPAPSRRGRVTQVTQ